MTFPAEEPDFVMPCDDRYVHAAIAELFPGRSARDLAAPELSRTMLRAQELKCEACRV